MFYTVKNLQSLIIDTDDFRPRPHLLTEIIEALDLVMKVTLVSRANFPLDAYQHRTSRPKTTTEQQKFSSLLRRLINELNLPPASTAFLCASRTTLELAKPLMIGTIVFNYRLTSNEERMLLYQEGPDFVVEHVEDLLRCLSITEKGFAAEVAATPDRTVTSAYTYSSPLILNCTTSLAPLNHPEKLETQESFQTTKTSYTAGISKSSPEAPGISKTTENPEAPRIFKPTESPQITETSELAESHEAPGISKPTESPESAELCRLTASSNATADKVQLQPTDESVSIVRLPNLEHPECPFYVMGRYFGPGDPRHQIHALSLRILKFKRNHTPHIKLFTELFEDGINAATDGAYDAITQVPSRPEVGDRLSYLLSQMRTNSANPDLIQPDILRCVRTYPPLKGMSLRARQANIKKVFAVQKDVRDKRIVIIDDVITTGATINACIEELKTAGAASICCAFLAYHPFSLRDRSFEPLSCSACHEPLDVRFDPSNEICFECHNGRNSEAVHSTYTFDEVVSSRIGGL